MSEIQRPKWHWLARASLMLFLLGLLSLVLIPVVLCLLPERKGWDALGQIILTGMIGISGASFLGLGSLVTGMAIAPRHKWVLIWIIPLMVLDLWLVCTGIYVWLIEPVWPYSKVSVALLILLSAGFFVTWLWFNLKSRGG
jgi:hypothetical protein